MSMRQRAGMTLLELMIGLVIMAAALSAGYGAFTGVADQRARAAEAMQAAAGAAQVRRTVVEWLQSARLTTREGGPAFIGLDRTRAGRPDDELSFLTSASWPGDGGDQVIRLSIDRAAETPERGLVAQVSEWPGLGSERIELVPGATGLDIVYLAELRDRQWLPSWISSSGLPLGVRIVLEGSGPDVLPPLLQLPILVAVGESR